MATSAEEPDPFDPFGLAAAMSEWCCMLKAAQELRNIDHEMMVTLMEAGGPAPAASSPEGAAKLRSIVGLMRSLGLDPDAVRQRDPEIVRQLEAACLDCRNRGRCARELWAGTAAGTYPDFCPNAARLDRLRRA
ncbi:DUF6455 family protein [Methylobacterium sp. C33D]